MKYIMIIILGISVSISCKVRNVDNLIGLWAIDEVYVDSISTPLALKNMRFDKAFTCLLPSTGFRKGRGTGKWSVIGDKNSFKIKIYDAEESVFNGTYNVEYFRNLDNGKFYIEMESDRVFIVGFDSFYEK